MISCVIPSYNGKTLLQQHLPQVLVALPDKSQLIISDDAGDNDTVDWLQTKFHLQLQPDFTFNEHDHIFPQPHEQKLDVLAGKTVATNKHIEIIVIHNHHNLRFAGAVNLAVQAATYDYVLILNNDVSPAKLAVKYLLKRIQTDNSIFAVSAIEYENSQDNQPSGKNKLWFERGIFQHAKADNFMAGQTAWASGGSSLIDRKKFMELGGFDLRYYPAYWEDIDLSFRAKQKGYQVLFEPKAIVYHQHESTHRTVWQQRELTLISWRNGDKFTWKNGDFWQKISFLLWKPYWWWLRSRDSASQA